VVGTGVEDWRLGVYLSINRLKFIELGWFALVFDMLEMNFTM